MRSWHLTLDDLEGSKSINWLISREWWEIMPWTQWATYIKSHVSFQMRSWPLTLDDLERSKSKKITYILGRVRDRAMNSVGSIYKVTCKLSNEVMTFNLDDLEGPNSTKWLISREWWEIWPWTQWATYIKLHVSFQMRSWPLTLNDL